MLLSAWQPAGPLASPGAICGRRALLLAPAPVARRERASSLTVENRVVIRFQRYGRTKLPFYRIVAIDSRARRNGRPIENLGFYDPLRKETNLNAPAIQKWLKVGAQTSETVANLLKKAMVMD